MSAYDAAKTHCKKGHPYEGDNLRVSSDGKRRCRACLKAATARWRMNTDTPEAKRKREKAWRDANRSHARSLWRRYSSDWYERNRASALDAVYRRRALTAGADGETVAYVELLRFDPCSYCGGEGGQVDHITPIAADGPHEWPNLTAACRSCNSSKGMIAMLEFLQRC